MQLNGANIDYQVVGQGPVLILIPGANGTGDIFSLVREDLKERFTVVTYDRRGFGKSDLTEPLPERCQNVYDDYRVKRDSQDISELATYLSDEPVYILGTSSGAIVAMHVLKLYPDIVKNIAFHEPPINTFLPDAIYWKKKNEAIVDDMLNKGLEEGMKTFSNKNNASSEDLDIMSKTTAQDEEAQKIRYEEKLFWAEYEIRQYTHSDITLEDLVKHKSRIFLLTGEASTETFVYEVTYYIAENINIDVKMMPSGHFGYVQQPQQFSEALIKIWL